MLARDFFLRDDVCLIAQELLGKYLMTEIEGKLTGGMIVETEAYCGQNDKACHASNGRRTPRTEVFYREGGIAYVYLCYGIHHLFNVITNREDKADAVLIRAIRPTDGVEEMLLRRQMTRLEPRLCKGPGSTAKALGIDLSHNAIPLARPPIWIEDRQEKIAPSQIMTGPRIGVEYAGEDAKLPWRYWV